MTTATDHVEVMSDGQPESLRVSVCGLSKGHKRDARMAEKDDVVVPQQDEISVYVSDALKVVIKREGRSEDDVVYFHPRHVPAICRALRRAAKQAREWESEDAQQ